MPEFLWPATLLKKKLGNSCFPVNFAKFLKAPFLKEHLWATASVQWQIEKYSLQLLLKDSLQVISQDFQI